MLDRTPFYAEGGGQLADEGVVQLGERRGASRSRRAGAGARADRAPGPGGRRRGGRRRRGARAIVDLERRLAISRAHTATHMVHKAFREALGEQATQMGSENSPGRLRFDFPSPTAVPGVGARRRRAAGQRGAARRPVGHRRGHEPGRGGRARARWRCSARSTATGSGSSASATGRASCAAAPTAAHRRARPGQAARRVVDRRRGAPGRGAGRGRRLPVPGPRAPAGRTSWPRR